MKKTVNDLPEDEQALLHDQYKEKPDYQIKETIRTNLAEKTVHEYQSTDFAKQLFDIHLKSDAAGENADELEAIAADIVGAVGDARQDHDVSNDTVLNVFDAYWRAYAFNEFKRTLKGDIGCPKELAQPILQDGYETMIGVCRDEIATL